MIIEALVRIGRDLAAGLSEAEILRLVSDVGEARVKNFFRHVFVVEIPPEDSGRLPMALPMQVWGEDEDNGQRRKAEFKPDLRRSLGAPFVYPKGGNPINPQGIYGHPVFIAFDKHFQAFRESPEAVRDFLQGRLRRSPTVSLTSGSLQAAAESLHQRIREGLSAGVETKTLGLVVLADFGREESGYELGDRSEGSIGDSVLEPGRSLIPRYGRILKRFWKGKLSEGEDGGRRAGSCTLCGRGERVISGYCKAWPWYFAEWRSPLPLGGRRDLMVQSIGLDEDCYRGLTLGASWFNKLTRSLHYEVTRELFTPGNDGQARRLVARKRISDLPTIYGAPLMVGLLEQPSGGMGESQALAEVLGEHDPRSGLLEHIENVTGFEVRLPNALSDQFRISLVYFSGQPSRGDIHLRALIEDVLPSTLRKLQRQRRPLLKAADDLSAALYPRGSEKQRAYLRARCALLPFLLARGWGGPYLWSQLERALRHKPLSLQRPVRNAARRMASLLTGLPDSEYQLREEVFFHLILLDFVSRHNRESAEGGGTYTPMRPWKQLLDAVLEAPPTELELEGPSELGFACGVLVRQFSRQYWQATKTGREGKDYLKHRVVTFGSSLTPEVLWKRGLPQIFELETRLQNLHLSEDFRQRLGVVLNLFERTREEIRSQYDAFMAGFWSGYALQGAAIRSATGESISQEETA